MSTLLKELAVERFRFSCPGCGHSWTTDYDVQHVEDGHGLTWEYYSLNGLPVPAPTAPESVCCPRCGASWVHFDLVAVREVPLVADPVGAEQEADRPRQPVHPARQAARRRAQLLRGEQPATEQPRAAVKRAEATP